MSLSDRRTLLFLLAATPLAACGFTPAYAPGGAAGALRGRIRAQDPTDKNSFDLVTRLQEQFGRPEAALYDLTFKITTRQVGLGIAQDNTTTRYNLIGRVDWTLTARKTEAKLVAGRADSTTAWFDTGTPVATLAAEEDAALRLMRILADQIVTRILATADDWS